MPEITVVGENVLGAAWGWEIALYLFLGGLAAGLMIYGGAMRVFRRGHFQQALRVADLAGLPLLGVGMLFLFMDLSNKINVWRMYTTFQVQSPMSWGAWILLVTLLLLALRFVGQVPSPQPATLLGLRLFPAPPGGEEEGEKPAAKPSAAVSVAQWIWLALDRITGWARRFDRALAYAGLALGIGVGFYTGVLLSTLPSRPLWNSAVLAPLFLVSALASGGAFLCLFLPREEHEPLVPFSIFSCGVEILLLLAYALSLSYGSRAAQRAGSILFNGGYGWVFWGLVLLVGLLAPAGLEVLETTGRSLPFSPRRLPPSLKLVGSLALRFVIVYAGVLSFL